MGRRCEFWWSCVGRETSGVKFTTSTSLSFRIPLFLSLLTSCPMPEVVPSLLIPYLGYALEPASLTLVTSTLTTPTNWLLVRFLYALLQGLDGTARSTPNSAANPVNSKASIIFVSVARPQDLWNELCKKVVSIVPCFPPLQHLLRDLVPGIGSSVLPGS